MLIVHMPCHVFSCCLVNGCIKIVYYCFKINYILTCIPRGSLWTHCTQTRTYRSDGLKEIHKLLHAVSLSLSVSFWLICQFWRSDSKTNGFVAELKFVLIPLSVISVSILGHHITLLNILDQLGNTFHRTFWVYLKKLQWLVLYKLFWESFLS